jgi:hypothetical protein
MTEDLPIARRDRFSGMILLLLTLKKGRKGWLSDEDRRGKDRSSSLK